jgi:hypothetical protein
LPAGDGPEAIKRQRTIWHFHFKWKLSLCFFAKRDFIVAGVRVGLRYVFDLQHAVNDDGSRTDNTMFAASEENVPA